MRRVWAAMLSVLFSCSLIVPAVIASSASRVPECCRRLGKHHCMMTSGLDKDEPSEPALQNVPDRCPYNLAGWLLPAQGYSPFLTANRMHMALLSSHPAAQTQNEARHCAAFQSATQERGPPTIFSSANS